MVLKSINFLLFYTLQRCMHNKIAVGCGRKKWKISVRELEILWAQNSK